MAMTDIGAALLRTLDPETAHRLAIRALKLAPLPAPPASLGGSISLTASIRFTLR